MAGLSGMKEIANYAKRSEATIIKWHREYGFPMVKIDGTWEADTDLIDDWRRKMVNGGNEPPPAKKKVSAGRKGL